MRTILLAITILPLLSGAQLIDPPEDLDFQLAGFNHRFISKNRIKSIVVSKSIKRNGQAMEKVIDKRTYFFDLAGIATRELIVKEIFGKPDTTFQITRNMKSIEYSRRGCKQERLSTPCINSWHIQTYACDCEIQGLEIIVQDSMWVSSQNIVVEEPNLWQLQKQYSYDDDPPYLLETEQYDSLGFLEQRTREFLITRQKEIVQFEYNLHGQPKRVFRKSDITGKTSSSEFEYDTFNSLISFRNWTQGKLLSEGEFVYGDTALPDGAVEQKPNGEIIMYKFTYEFYD